MVPSRSYLHGDPVGFGEAIRYGLHNWLVYRGRSSPSAYWWFTAARPQSRPKTT